MARKRNRVRLKMDTRTPLLDSLDVFTSNSPQMPRARAVQFEIAIFDGDVLDDVSDIQTITLEVKADVGSAALFTQTLAAAAMKLNLLKQEWDGGVDANCHALFTFVEAVTALDLSGGTSKTFILVVTALTSIGNFTVGKTTLTCVNDGGLTAANSPAAGDPAFLRVDQFQALAANFVKVEGDAGAPIILKSANGKWLRRIGISDIGVRTDEPSKIG